MRKKKKLGLGFADEVVKVTFNSGHFRKKEGGGENWKELLLPNFNPNSAGEFKRNPWISVLFFSLLLGLFFIIFLRLFHLQIIEGRSNRELADGNRIQIKIIHAPRGVIFDRNGKILAANSPAFRLVDRQSGKAKLITREQALVLEAKNDLRVKDLEVDNVRTYPQGEIFSHVVGYLGQISKEQLSQAKFKDYQSGDMVGQSGVEAEYESVLRGVDGGEIIEVDSMGRQLRSLRRNPPISGKNIYLTIDAPLQQKIYQISKDTLEKTNSCCGAVVAMDPGNGQVLALLSFPSFDGNIFTKFQDDEAISNLFTDSSFPLLNRVIGGTYPPGSTFKIISSLAALASGKITPATIIEDTGIMYLGPYSFTNWYFNQYGKTEGPVNLIKAIKRSNDTYYYRISQIIGEKSLIDWARKMRFNSKSGIDLPGEVLGLIPDEPWKQKTFGEVWFPGDTLHMAIGQGFVLTTPIQVLGITSYIGANGNLYKPYLNSQSKPQLILSNLTDIKNIKILQQGLAEVTKINGTAWPFFTFPVATAGKTGTAEFGDPKNKTHAWYTGYAPVGNPRIVMTVLIEGGGEGSSVAAPIVKEAFRYYLSEDKNNLIKDVYYNATDSAKTLGEESE